MTPSTFIVVPTMLLGLLACRGEPELNCERVRFGWPDFDESPSTDISSAEGIQIDVAVRSDLIPGATATLKVTQESVPEDERVSVLAGEARADADGLLVFRDVTIPVASVLFSIEAKDACGTARSSRRIFVWDGLGKPKCDLRLADGPDADPLTGTFELQAADDEDPGIPGLQTRFVVAPGRSDMEVTLFVVDRETGDRQNFSLPLDDNAEGTQALTLAEGEQAARADCYWPSEDLHVPSATRVFFVDTTN